MRRIIRKGRGVAGLQGREAENSNRELKEEDKYGDSQWDCSNTLCEEVRWKEVSRNYGLLKKGVT